MEDIRDALKKIALFADLPDEMLNQLADKFKTRELADGEVLFQEGDEGNTLYFIQSGEIEIYHEDEGDGLVVLSTLKAGEYFGEMALVEDKPRSASARTLIGTMLLSLERKPFVELLENNPSLALKLTSAISARLRTASQPLAPPGITPTPVESATQVFISYSRKDKEFVQQLHIAISKKGIDTWVDWENIPLTADWWNEIRLGIEKTDAFAFVISPDSLNSEVCEREIQTAVDNNKRLIPILHREPQKGDPMHEKISSHNWVYMRSDRELQANLSQMLAIVNTDLGFVRTHTRLLERALEWDRAKKNASFLLHGDDLQNAETWLEEAGTKQPQPTALQIEYVQASRREASRRQRNTLIAAFVALGVTLILAVVSFVFFLQARQAQNVAEEARDVAIQSAGTAQAANDLAQDSAATADAERAIAIDAQATAEADRNLAATAQADAEMQEFIARSERLESLPLTMLDSQLDLALLMSIEAYHFNPSLSSERTLFTAWSHNPELIRYLQGHEHAVLTAAWSPDRQLVTGGEDGIIILWDNQSGLPAREFQAIKGEILELSWSSDGQLASADSNGNVIVWDISNGTPAEILSGHTGEVNALSWSPKDQLTSGGEDGNIIVWNLQQGQPQYTLSKTGASINDLDWSRTGILASANSDDTVTIWGENETEEDFFDTPPFSTTETIPVGGFPGGLTLSHFEVQTVAWSPEGELASGGFQDIILWDLRFQQPKITLQGHSLFVDSLSWSERGELASGSSDNTVIVWDLESGGPGKIYRGHSDWVQAVDWSPDGILASAALDRTVILWHPNERAGKTLRADDKAILTTAYAPDGTLASGVDEDVILWNLETGRPEKTLSAHTDVVTRIAWSPEGQLASGGEDRQVILWDLESGTPAKTLQGHKAPVIAIQWSPDGQLATSDLEGTVIVWDLESGQPRWTSPGNGMGVTISWSPDEELTIGSEDMDTGNGIITILDAETFEPVKTMSSEEDRIFVLAWSPDGRLVSDGRNYQLISWNLETGQPETRLRGHSNSITALAWSSDGKLASSAEDNTVILWDLEGNAPAFVLHGHTSLVEDISWAPDGKQLASAALDATVMVWDVTPEEWIMKNCSRAGRNFRRDEWDNFFPGEEYRVACGQQPVPGETP